MFNLGRTANFSGVQVFKNFHLNMVIDLRNTVYAGTVARSKVLFLVCK